VISLSLKLKRGLNALLPALVGLEALRLSAQSVILLRLKRRDGCEE